MLCRTKAEARNRGPAIAVSVASRLIEGSRLMNAPAYLDRLCIELQALLLVNKKLLDVLALVALKLDHLTHFGVIDNRAIAS